LLDLRLPARHDWAVLEQHYGKLVIEPFEPGFALTVGIAYRRRVLLSAIAEGAPSILPERSREQPRKDGEPWHQERHRERRACNDPDRSPDPRTGSENYESHHLHP
jgi:hypothetical protein